MELEYDSDEDGVVDNEISGKRTGRKKSLATNG